MRLGAILQPLMTIAEMAAADAASPGCGVPSMTLMENAGRSVADEIGRRFTPRPTAILCGPGNNGGDGYVVARLLARRGWPVQCFALGDTESLKGDAATARQRWAGPVKLLSGDPPQADLYVDALFGAGLSRPLTEQAARFARFTATVPQKVVAIDVPSGLNGDTGQPLGKHAVSAGLTITFVRRKPGHVLTPGRYHCGDVVCGAIAMPEACLPEASPLHAVTGLQAMPSNPAAHKYDRGHCLVISGGSETTGASRLAAIAVARSGAGLTTIAAPADAARVHAAHLTSIMVRAFTDSAGLAELLKDRRRSALVIGPGLGLDQDAQDQLDLALIAGRPSVLDADALTLIARTQPWPLPPHIVLTPHGGEFARLFPDIAASLARAGKLAATRAAAARAGCIVLFKGPDTVIASPVGRAVIDMTAPPTLATAGSGDVLAGLIGGLLAQGHEPFDAAVTAVALHAAAARHLGTGLLADDLPLAIPAVMRALDTR